MKTLWLSGSFGNFAVRSLFGRPGAGHRGSRDLRGDLTQIKSDQGLLEWITATTLAGVLVLVIRTSPADPPVLRLGALGQKLSD